MHKDIKIQFYPQLGQRVALLKTDPLYGVYCPVEGTIIYNNHCVTLPKGTLVRVKEIQSIKGYICTVVNDNTLKVEREETFDECRVMHGSIIVEEVKL